MIFRVSAFTLTVIAAQLAAGCSGLDVLAGDRVVGAPEIATKATSVAGEVGGPAGFGGMLMAGYSGHAPMAMGFLDSSDLAAAGAGMMVRVSNNSDQAVTCHISFVASSQAADEQGLDVEIPPGEEVTLPISCCEIVGAGPLESPGGVACHLADGQTVDNRMAVPAFLGLDYQCGQAHEFMLTPDVDDLDADGDTDELIMLSQAMLDHMSDGGPMGHGHGRGTGMMGMHGARE